MNMMFGVQCEKMVHKSKTIPTSRLDHVGDMIPYNQMIVHGSEMVQGIHTTHGNDTAESVVRTKSRCGGEMVSSDHSGKMINCKQTVICGSEMVQGIEMTHDNGTTEVTTSSRCSNRMDHGEEMIHCNQMVIRDSEMVQGIEMTHGTYTVEAAPTASRHGCEMVPGRKMVHGCSMIRCNQMAIHDRQMVQGIEMPHGNDTAEAAPDAPPTTARRRRKNSIIWQHFTTETDSDGCTRACCNYCKRTFACSKTAGTSHLKRHITLGSCPVMKGQVPPSSGRTGNRGSCAAKRQCLHAGPGNDTFNRNGNTLYLGNMDILTEPLATKQGNEYSISKCLKVLHDMDNVSDEIKHLAFHVLKDATNREIFMSYESRLRGLWLKKEISKL